MTTTVSIVPARAENSNSTPHALNCMAKAGFTREMWVAKHAGTNAQVAQYIACRDGTSVAQAKKDRAPRRQLRHLDPRQIKTKRVQSYCPAGQMGRQPGN